jgi:hypothetical protein
MVWLETTHGLANPMNDAKSQMIINSIPIFNTTDDATTYLVQFSELMHEREKWGVGYRYTEPQKRLWLMQRTNTIMFQNVNYNIGQNDAITWEECLKCLKMHIRTIKHAESSNLKSKESDATARANLDMSVQNINDPNVAASNSNNNMAAAVVDTSRTCWECGEIGHTQYKCDRYLKRIEREKIRNKDKKSPNAKDSYKSNSNKSSAKSPNKGNYKGKHFNKDYNKNRKHSDDEEESKPSKKAKKQDSDEEVEESPKKSNRKVLKVNNINLEVDSEDEYEIDERQEFFINKINESFQNNYSINNDHDIEILEEEDMDQQI